MIRLLSITAIFLMVLFSFDVVCAQAKRKMMEENEQLKNEKVELQKANVQLEREKQSLQKENNALKQENQMLTSEVRRLQENVNDLKEANRNMTNKIAEASMTNAGKSSVTGNSKKNVEEVKVDPNDKRPCAVNQAKLAANQSYFLTLNKLNTKGWGIQIYSYSTLCMALEKAQEFSKQYKMYNTYIRVKEVDGRRVFSVIYGSLKDEASARSYCENFRKIAKDNEGQNAFIVQH